MINFINIRIAAGRFNQSIARFYPSTLLSFENHSLCDSVLDGTSGVEELAFCVDGSLDAEALRDSVKFDERCLADVLKNV